MNGEIVHDIARELGLSREKLQKLTSAVKFVASGPQNSNKSASENEIPVLK
jgi:hypothetical protein